MLVLRDPRNECQFKKFLKIGLFWELLSFRPIGCKTKRIASDGLSAAYSLFGRITRGSIRPEIKTRQNAIRTRQNTSSLFWTYNAIRMTVMRCCPRRAEMRMNWRYLYCTGNIYEKRPRTAIKSSGVFVIKSPAISRANVILKF